MTSFVAANRIAKTVNEQGLTKAIRFGRLSCDRRFWFHFALAIYSSQFQPKDSLSPWTLMCGRRAGNRPDWNVPTPLERDLYPNAKLFCIDSYRQTNNGDVGVLALRTLLARGCCATGSITQVSHRLLSPICYVVKLRLQWERNNCSFVTIFLSVVKS